jgi:hypothetical protein
MTTHLIDGTYELFRHFYRVKGFASRGLAGMTRDDALMALGEELRVSDLHQDYGEPRRSES